MEVDLSGRPDNYQYILIFRLFCIDLCHIKEKKLTVYGVKNSVFYYLWVVLNEKKKKIVKNWAEAKMPNSSGLFMVSQWPKIILCNFRVDGCWFFRLKGKALIFNCRRKKLIMHMSLFSSTPRFVESVVGFLGVIILWARKKEKIRLNEKRRSRFANLRLWSH